MLCHILAKRLPERRDRVHWLSERLKEPLVSIFVEVFPESLANDRRTSKTRRVDQFDELIVRKLDTWVPPFAKHTDGLAATRDDLADAAYLPYFV